MPSLAPIKYRHFSQTPNELFAEQKIVTVSSPILGDFFESYVYFHKHLRPAKKYELKLYGSPDGSGTAFTKNEAYYRAISEALERWAFYSTSKSVDQVKFGFDVEPSSTGMAAFPGLFKTSARKNAYYEAVERWSICAWWERKISHRPLTFDHELFNGIEISTPFTDTSVVILWTTVNQFYQAYSFAAHKNVEKAIHKAQVELSRNYCVLKKFVKGNNKINIEDISDIHESRLSFFASQEGQQIFTQRIHHIPTQKISHTPQKLVDTEIPGPWSTYTTVWRVLFEPISKEHLSSRSDYFLF